MEDVSILSSASSASASDSDAYNAESARLYLGPHKTPERKSVDSKRLFPSTQTTFPRRSPRLSSPRMNLPSKLIDDSEDMDLVAQLIIASSEDEEDSATRQAADVVEDEPTSALADRVMYALDNPSPPPSPTLPLSFFDPYHTTTPQSATDYQNDLLSLNVNNRPEHHDDNPLSLSTTISESYPKLTSQVLQQDLISFDCVPTLHPSKEASSSPLLKESVPISHWPIPIKSSRVQQTFEIPDLVVEPPLENLLVDSVTAINLTQTAENAREDPSVVLHNSEPRTDQLSVGHVLSQPLNVEMPVRRSPRKSITPNLEPPPAALSLPSSGARTKIKKKLSIGTFNECIDDSQGEQEDSEEEIAQQVQTTSSALWSARQCSPTRSPMSFNRVLGSLSPKSTDLLSKLAFKPTEEHVSLGSSGEPSSDEQVPFFPLPESMAPEIPSRSTGPTRFSSPTRSTGPIRFSSPTRPTSPHKIRLQAPPSTPARRIPIEEGVIQGYVSPQKAAQHGFKPDGTPFTSIQLPARRVLISEQQAIPVTRPGGVQFGSPSKGKERERSLELSSVLARRNDKEKITGQSSTETLAKPSTVQPDKLPFPLVASNPAPSAISPLVPKTCQSSLPQEKPANVKSSLRQPTSRIPRIGTKPYNRPPALNSREKEPSTLAKRITDLTKKPTTTKSAFIGTPSSISHIRPTASTSTSLLKRKREVEKPSLVKPRTIPIRQVPKVVLTTTTSPKTRFAPSTIPNPKNTPHNSALQPGRALDSEISKALHSMPQESEAPTIAYNPQPAEIVMKSPETKESSPLPPDSPMVEDLPELQSKPEPIPPDDIPTSDASSTSRPRRTTRSRRNPINEGSARPLPTRRKPPSSRSDGVFSDMSITALKDLTTSNTARNQQYLFAKLETEVIRKEGVRPESPAVKIRTILERQMEEKIKERTERAIRRARRSDGDMVSSDIEDSSDVGYSDVGYSSPCEDRSRESPLTKHRRGPGDEEDYETPEKLDQCKSTKLFVETDNQSGEPERRVKWDRGLFTTVYLDEVKLGTRQPLKENRSLKGILAPTAKALRLDTLGNLQAELPLTDLVQENITIKKYVYDNDLEPVPELILVKNTRSKSKKNKS